MTALREREHCCKSGAHTSRVNSARYSKQLFSAVLLSLCTPERELYDMAFRALRLHGSLILSAWLSACANSHDVLADSSPAARAGADAITLDASAQNTSTRICMRLTTSQCQAEQRCCSMPGRSLEACMAARLQDCEQSAHLDSVAMNPISGFDATTAQTLFTELEDKLEACDPSVVGWSTSADGLRRLFKGSVASGQSCKPQQLLNADESQQTAALLSCKDPESSACLPASLLGEWTCAAKSMLGGNCLTDDNCESDAYCSTPADAFFGTCSERLALAAACSGVNQCQSFNCSAGICKAPDPQAAFCPSAQPG
jgi:hypothetical protein